MNRHNKIKYFRLKRYIKKNRKAIVFTVIVVILLLIAGNLIKQDFNNGIV